MKKVTIINTVLLTGFMLHGSLQIHAAAQDDNNQKRIMGATAQQNAAATLIQAGIRGALERRAVQQGVAVQSAEIQEQLMPQIELVPQAESAQCVVLMPQPELMNEGERSLAMPLVQSDDSSEDSQSSDDNEAINQLLQQNNNDLQAALFDAARNNRTGAFKGLMQRGVNLNTSDQFGLTPLLAAAHRGHVEIVRMLIDANADVNAADQNGNTPLMEAAQEGHVEIVRMLIGVNADVNRANQNGNTSLIMAAFEGRVEIVKMLMVANADVNMANQHGVTALLAAVYAGHVEIVRMLMVANAAVNGANQYGNTSLKVAAQEGHVEIMRMLMVANADVNAADQNGNTPLMEAAQEGHVEIVRMLIGVNADVNIVGQDGITALIFAAQAGTIDAVRMLIDAGASIDLSSKDGITALIATSDFEITRLLIDSYRAQLASRHPENLIGFTSRDFDQFNRRSELRSMGNVLNQVGELITSYLLDNDRRNLVNTGCSVYIKAAINGRNGQAHQIKIKLFTEFITSALQKLVSTKEKFAGNGRDINNIEKTLALLNQELAQGYYVREREKQNIESQAHAAACCVVVQQDGPAVAVVDEQAGSADDAQDRQVLPVEDRYAAERALRAEENNEYEESVRIDRCRDELEIRIAQLMEQVQPFLVEQNIDVASPIVDAVSFESFQKARDLFAGIIVARAELIDIAKKGLMLDPTYAEHKAARIAQQEQVLAHEQAQLQMTESALDDFISAPTQEEIREQRIKMLGGQGS